MSDIISGISTLIAYVVGGTIGSGSDVVTITYANSWLGKISSAVTDNALLLLFVGIGLVGLGIGFFKRIIN